MGSTWVFGVCNWFLKFLCLSRYLSILLLAMDIDIWTNLLVIAINKCMSLTPNSFLEWRPTDPLKGQGDPQEVDKKGHLWSTWDTKKSHDQDMPRNHLSNRCPKIRWLLIENWALAGAWTFSLRIRCLVVEWCGLIFLVSVDDNCFIVKCKKASSWPFLGRCRSLERCWKSKTRFSMAEQHVKTALFGSMISYLTLSGMNKKIHDTYIYIRYITMPE